jgi:hypothetical protein
LGRVGALAGALREAGSTPAGRARRVARQAQVRVYDEAGAARTLSPEEDPGAAIVAAAARMLDAVQR